MISFSIKFYSVLIIVFLLAQGSHQADSTRQINSNYIWIEYAYDHSEKPVPIIVFNVDSVTTKKLRFAGYKFKITRKEFLEIENVIRGNSSYIIIDSLAVRYFDLIVTKDGKRTIYGTVNLRRSKELVSRILDKLHKRRDYPDISKAFDRMYTYLSPRGNVK